MKSKHFIIAVLFLAATILVVINFEKILTWIKNVFNSVTKTDLPQGNDLSNPEYIISDKIIKNYVEELVTAVDKWGTDELALDKIYKILKATDIQNTLNFWNEFNNRGYYYSPALGQFITGVKFGTDAAQYNLYEVLKFELRDNQSEKNAFVNWDWLLRSQAHLV